MELSNPFSCGTQVLDWKERNCKRCKTGYDEKTEHYNCWIEKTLDYGLNVEKNKGEFNVKFLLMIGYNEKTKGQLTWDCPARKVK